MSDLDLGALSAQLKLQVGELDASVRKAVARLDDLEAAGTKAEKKTEDLGKTMKNALKGEVIINAVNRIASSVGQISPEFERASKSIQGAGAVLQGFFQGGLVGAGIAGLGVFTASIAEDFREIQKLADAADKATQRSLDTMASGYAKVADSLTEVTKKLEAVNDAKKYGITLSEAEFKIRAQEITSAIGSLRLSSARSTSLAEQAGPGYDRGFRESAAADSALADKKQQELDLLASSMRLAKEMEGLDKGTDALGKSTKQATKPLSDLAKAIAEARSYTPDTMLGGQAVSPGQMARALAEFGNGSTTEPGSISEERLARQRRNAEYRANSGDTLMVDDVAAARRRWATENRGLVAKDSNVGSDDNKSSKMARAQQDFTESLKNLDYAVKTAVEGLGSVAPKTATLVTALASQDWGAAIGVIASNSKELSKVGDMLDSALVDAIGKVTQNIRPALPVIKVALDAIVQLFDLVGSLLGLSNVLNGMDAKAREMFDAFKYFAGGLAALSAGVKWVTNAIRDTVNNIAIAILESNDVTKALFAKDIERMKGEISHQSADLGKVMGDAAKPFWDLSYDATMAGLGLDDLGSAAEKVAQSFLNLPAGFKVAAAVFDAAQSSGDAWGGYTPPVGSSASMPSSSVAPPVFSNSGGGHVYNFYGAINVYGDGSFEANVAKGAPQMPLPNQPTPYPPTP